MEKFKRFIFGPFDNKYRLLAKFKKGLSGQIQNRSYFLILCVQILLYFHRKLFKYFHKADIFEKLFHNKYLKQKNNINIIVTLEIVFLKENKE